MRVTFLEGNGCCECDNIGGDGQAMPCRSGKCVKEEHGNYNILCN